MARILYIQASPRGERSYSTAVAAAFITAYKEANPQDEIVTLNPFERNLGPFDGLVLQAKYNILHGKKHSAEELAAWKAVEAVIDEFKSADKYIMSIPMWNFSIPYRLKQYIDILVQPTYTFSYSPDEGYKGLVGNKPVFIAYSRGGEYPVGTPGEGYDFQTKYLELILGFIGLTDIRKVIVEPTLQGGPDIAKERRDAAISKAKEMAKLF